MADDIRIKDLQSTASYMESDDYLPIDSLALGNRKIPFTGLMDSEDDRLPTTDKTPRGAITEHEGDISEIKQSLSYKYIETKTGTGTVSFPSTTKELYIMVSWNNDMQYAYPFHIAVTGNGYFMVGGGYGDAVIYISATNHTVNINTVTYNGTNVSANAKMAVYYR